MIKLTKTPGNRLLLLTGVIIDCINYIN